MNPKWWIKNEPVLASSVVAAIGVFSTLRWSGSKADLVAQIIGGLLPIVLGLVSRQFVTPTAKMRLIEAVTTTPIPYQVTANPPPAPSSPPASLSPPPISTV